MAKYIDIEDVLQIVGADGAQLTRADIESQPTTRRLVVLEGEFDGAASVSVETSPRGGGLEDTVLKVEKVGMAETAHQGTTRGSATAGDDTSLPKITSTTEGGEAALKSSV
jgi:hypothetical protein